MDNFILKPQHMFVGLLLMLYVTYDTNFIFRSSLSLVM